MAGGGVDQRALLDLVTSGAQDIASGIARPNMEAPNFELKATLIAIMQQS